MTIALVSERTELKVDGEIAYITLCYPDKNNAFDDQMIADIRGYLSQIRSDETARVVVLRATGKHFSAGADLAWMKRMAKLDQAENATDATKLGLLMRELKECPLPTIAAVHGAAFGGAVGLIACCDIAIADEDALFSLSEVRLGLAPATIGPFVAEAIGLRQARKLFLTGERFGASKAKEIGLIHDLVPPQGLDQALRLVVDQLLAGGPVAQQRIKDLLNHISDETEKDKLYEWTASLIAELRVSKEGQAGLQAFFDKQKPYWHPESSDT